MQSSVLLFLALGLACIDAGEKCPPVAICSNAERCYIFATTEGKQKYTETYTCATSSPSTPGWKSGWIQITTGGGNECPPVWIEDELHIKIRQKTCDGGSRCFGLFPGNPSDSKCAASYESLPEKNKGGWRRVEASKCPPDGTKVQPETCPSGQSCFLYYGGEIPSKVTCAANHNSLPMEEDGGWRQISKGSSNNLQDQGQKQSSKQI